MSQQVSFYQRYGRAIVLVVLILLPGLFYGSKSAIESNSNDVREWLPEASEVAETYDWFLRHFTTDEVIVVSWDGCNLDDERLARLAKKLRLDSSFESVVTGAEMLERLMTPPSSFQRQEALRRLEGSFVGADHQTTCLVVVTAKSDGNERQRIVSLIRRQSASCGIPSSQLHLGGPVVDAVAIDEEGQRAVFQLGSLSACISAILAWVCLRRVWIVCVVVLTAVIAAAGSMSILAWTGGSMNAVLIVMPSLIVVLSIAGAIHFINYYIDAVREEGIQGAAGRAVRTGWLPCTLAAGTTALGIGALTVSRVVPVRDFGAYSAIGLGVSLACLLLVLPSLLELVPVREDLLRDRASWSLFEPWVASFHRWIVTASLLLMVFFAYGLMKLETSVKLQSLFASRSRIMGDYRWLEQHLGPMVPMEVVLRLDNQTCKLDLIERVDLVDRVGREIERLDKVDGAMSVAVFTPQIPWREGLRATARRIVIRRGLTNHRDEFRESHLLADTDQEELWRISFRVEALNDLNYALFAERVRQQVEPVLKGQRDAGIVGLSAEYTGCVPLIYQAQDQMLEDLISSFVMAFALIAGVMMVMLRSVPAGLLSMIPNLFPTVLIFGAMGWLGVKVDLGTMINASLALGIAVDDTLHFLTWFRRGIRAGRSRRDAVRLAYERCTRAIIQTTLIGSLGLLVLAFSTFVPSTRFAWMMCTLLTAALIGDLVFLPAILIGPLGCFFERQGPPVSAKA